MASVREKGLDVGDQASRPREDSESGAPASAGRKSIWLAPPPGSLRLKILLGVLAATIVWYMAYLGTGGGDFTGFMDAVRGRLAGEDPRAAAMRAAPWLPRHLPRAVMEAGYGSRRGQRAMTAEEAEGLRVAADAGDANARFRVGIVYQFGLAGIAANPSEAVRYYRLAADAGQSRARANLGILYENGAATVPRDLAEAMRLFRAAAAQGDVIAEYHLAVIYMQGRDTVAKDEAAAVPFLTALALRGDPDAEFMLGFLYLHGRGGLVPDEGEAARLLTLASAQGLPNAQAALAEMYREGRGGLPHDSATADRLDRLVAAGGAGDTRFLGLAPPP